METTAESDPLPPMEKCNMKAIIGPFQPQLRNCLRACQKQQKRYMELMNESLNSVISYSNTVTQLTYSEMRRVHKQICVFRQLGSSHSFQVHSRWNGAEGMYLVNYWMILGERANSVSGGDVQRSTGPLRLFGWKFQIVEWMYSSHSDGTGANAVHSPWTQSANRGGRVEYCLHSRWRIDDSGYGATSVCLSGELAYGFVDAARHRVVDAEGTYRPDGRVCVGVEIWPVCRQWVTAVLPVSFR